MKLIKNHKNLETMFTRDESYKPEDKIFFPKNPDYVRVFLTEFPIPVQTALAELFDAQIFPDYYELKFANEFNGVQIILKEKDVADFFRKLNEIIDYINLKPEL